MSRLFKGEQQEHKVRKSPTCIDCRLPADVYCGDVGLCSYDYARRVAYMRRNADGLMLESGVYRRPTEDERKMRVAVLETHRNKVRASNENIKRVKRASGLHSVGAIAEEVYGPNEH